MPGRLRTASRPSSTWIAEASYDVPASGAVPRRAGGTASAAGVAAGSPVGEIGRTLDGLFLGHTHLFAPGCPARCRER